MPTPAPAPAVAMNLRISPELRAALDVMVEATGLPYIRIIDTLLRDDLALPATAPRMATRLRNIAKKQNR